MTWHDVAWRGMTWHAVVSSKDRVVNGAAEWGTRGGFDTTTADFQFVHTLTWMPDFNIGYKMGIDGISMLFVMLTTLLTPICILASWENIDDRVKEYMISFLVLETFMIGMFCSLDMVVFYIFFEAVLIPMFVIIGVWGGPGRVYAAFKLFLYTLLGSVLMLLALLAMYFTTGSTDIPTGFQCYQVLHELRYGEQPDHGCQKVNSCHHIDLTESKTGSAHHGVHAYSDDQQSDYSRQQSLDE